jgi:hypothetical protein
MDSNLLITIAGIVASVVTSFVISTRQSRLEVKKLRDEYLHRYSGKIFEKRLESYPKIVEHLIPIIHKINFSEINKQEQYEIRVDELKNFLQVLLVWDTQNSILFSKNLQTVLHNRYHELYSIINDPNEKLQSLVTNHKFLERLKNDLLELFLALKNDLGIYSLELPSAITGFKSPDTLEDLAKLSKK